MDSVEIMLENKYVKYVMCCVGALIYAIGFRTFLTPLGLYAGGALGLGQMINSLLSMATGLDLDLSGTIYFLINVPLFILAFKVIGHTFLLKTAINVACMSFFLSVIPASETMLVEDTITSVIIGAIICGCGVGLTLRSGGSGGGTEILGLYFAKKGKNVGISKIYLTLNVIIYSYCFFMYSPATAIYSIIYSVFCSMTFDKVHVQSINVETMIFTKTDGTAIRDILVNDLGRTATIWHGVGGYMHEDTVIIYAVLSKYEATIMRRHVKEVDPHAFMVLNEGCHISGNFPSHM